MFAPFFADNVTGVNYGYSVTWVLPPWGTPCRLCESAIIVGVKMGARLPDCSTLGYEGRVC
jgi:hypothetical protein